jgi:hypothetical protein
VTNRSWLFTATVTSPYSTPRGNHPSYRWRQAKPQLPQMQQGRDGVPHTVRFAVSQESNDPQRQAASAKWLIREGSSCPGRTLWAARRPCCEAEISFTDCAAVDEGSGRPRRDVRPRCLGVRRRVDLGQGHRRLIRCRSGGGDFLCEATRVLVALSGGSRHRPSTAARVCRANAVLEAAGVALGDVP